METYYFTDQLQLQQALRFAMNERGNNLRPYGTNFSTGIEKLYVFILLASGLVVRHFKHVLGSAF